MLGCPSGSQKRFTAAKPYVRKLHCMIHRYALSEETLSPDIKFVLNDVRAMLNFYQIQSSEHTDVASPIAEDESLLFHSEVRWLRGVM